MASKSARAVAWLALLLLGSTCTDSAKERARAARLSAHCSLNSDCSDPLVCAFSRCHEECASSRDCPDGARCVVSQVSDLRICQLDDEVNCTEDDDCVGAQVCASDSECRDTCVEGADCAAYQLCVEGFDVCADSAELDEGGNLTPAEVDSGVTPSHPTDLDSEVTPSHPADLDSGVMPLSQGNPDAGMQGLPTDDFADTSTALSTSENDSVETSPEATEGTIVESPSEDAGGTCSSPQGSACNTACGDGVRQVGEQCDDGNAVNSDSCLDSCQWNACGDGKVFASISQAGNPNAREECDDGNGIDDDACRNDCHLPLCGDGITQTPEECDDGNGVNSDACNSNCLAAICGDGIAQEAEQCDDGNVIDTDSCTQSCAWNTCGDGWTYSVLSDTSSPFPREACDDGNAINDDACSSNCELPRCGDGVVQAGEQCDDGIENGLGTCSAQCASTSCTLGQSRPCSLGGFRGSCGLGTQSCTAQGGWGSCSVTPLLEDTCDPGNDDTCDGVENEGCPCTLGQTRFCSQAGLYGVCADGIQDCNAQGGWDPCSVTPALADVCEIGNDDNCNGFPADDCECFNGDEEPCGTAPEVGLCHLGTHTCVDGVWGECVGEVTPALRNCASPLDNDCDDIADNTPDDVCQCVIDAVRPCAEHPGFDGAGACQAGTETCTASVDGSATSWDLCLGAQGPVTEVCDGSVDESCDGFIDEACSCPGNAGPSMVRLPQGYCIDSTEVSRAQYQTWLATNPTTAGQSADCTWNTTFVPANDWPPGAGEGNLPVNHVDWCDAYAYCQGAGKRLCGKIGGGAGDFGLGRIDSDVDQWFNACTSHGVNTFPYGNSYQPMACNGAGNLVGILPVGSVASCQPGGVYAGVYDQSGNVWEWEDACNGPGSAGLCIIRGGYYGNAESNLRCNSDGVPARNLTAVYLGFRCCSP